MTGESLEDAYHRMVTAAASPAPAVSTELPRNLHVQKPIPGPHGTVYVDEALAYLIEYLWDADLQTQHSCQGGSIPGTHSRSGIASESMFDSTLSDAHVMFAYVEQAVMFYQRTAMALGHELHDMALQMVPPRPRDYYWRARVLWRCDLTPLIVGVWQEGA